MKSEAGAMLLLAVLTESATAGLMVVGLMEVLV